MDQVVHVGGLDLDLRQRIKDKLNDAGFTATGSASSHFAGLDLANICNLCGRGMGVQLEISRGLRSQMFLDLTPQGRKHPSKIFYRFVQAVRDAIAPFAEIFVAAETLEPTD